MQEIEGVSREEGWGYRGRVKCQALPTNHSCSLFVLASWHRPFLRGDPPCPDPTAQPDGKPRNS